MAERVKPDLWAGSERGQRPRSTFMPARTTESSDRAESVPSDLAHGWTRPPVDTSRRSRHSVPVSKKPSKVQETATPYTAKQPVKAAPATSKPGPRSADLEKVRAGNAKLVQVHRKVLQKLAQ